MPEIQRQLAAFIEGSATADLPDDVLDQAKRSLADTAAVAVAGTRSDLATPIARYLSGTSGAYAVLGTQIRTSADRAALANGALAHALDFDDTVSAMPGHPGGVILPALLAALGQEPRSGNELLRAFVTGYEVATKFGAAIGSGHYNRGWHSTGTIGVFGACAAVAALLRLDREQIAAALGIAASMASGLRVNFGTMTKPLHSGWAASAGLTAATLAASGYTGLAAALDGKGGFFDVYGTAESTPESFIESLGAPYTLASPGISIKKYPCCFAMHRTIDALERMRAAGILGDPERVRSAGVHVPPGTLKPLPYTRPVTGLQGKFSMEYALAVGVHDGDFGLSAFTDEAVRRPEIKEVIERTFVVEDPECSPGDPDGRRASAGTRGFVDVRIELTNGERHRLQVRHAPGSPARPLSWASLREKFFACTEYGRLPAEHARAALDLIEGLTEVADVSRLVTHLAPVAEVADAVA
ncbi:MmgE/PrpD family protein [Acrocarpospora macrocephala]|uniref:MmgE/PrpD family protein n=1 Tax=Acrocarpospora macrocephala TaxID=150177 RepID=A0A5M3X2Q0_9ACTN|nr:MmgE/PrpD family protein [Acrocarpospora macrocephala]GES13093.1 hypothetical protein Amac_066900 [Acrocarpospora macrocephala]